MKLIKKYFASVYFIKIAFSLLLVCGLVACSDDKEEPEVGGNYPTTSFSKIQLSEVYTGDAQPVTTTHTYAFNRGRLSDYTSKQTYFVVEPIETQTTTTINYSDHQAIVTDGFGNVSTYTLNDKGYAIGCTRKEGEDNPRTYTFSYLTDAEGKCYLQNLIETLDDGTVCATIDIDHSISGALRITLHNDTFDQVYTAATATNNKIENLSEIPCLFLAELYPLSLHSAALYGKLLGEPFKTLITQIIPNGNTENNETTSYTYSLNKRGIVTFCNETINSNGKNYERTINYVIE